jgi:hypothetical protein
MVHEPHAKRFPGRGWLQDRGFVVMTQDSGFDHKRLAREWRLTIFPTGDCRAPTAPPTHDYVHWRPRQKNKSQCRLRIRIVPFGDTHLITMGCGHDMRASAYGRPSLDASVSLALSDQAQHPVVDAGTPRAILRTGLGTRPRNVLAPRSRTRLQPQ